MVPYPTCRLKESLNGPAQSRGAVSLPVTHRGGRALAGQSYRQ